MAPSRVQLRQVEVSVHVIVVVTCCEVPACVLIVILVFSEEGVFSQAPVGNFKLWLSNIDEKSKVLYRNQLFMPRSKNSSLLSFRHHIFLANACIDLTCQVQKTRVATLGIKYELLFD